MEVTSSGAQAPLQLLLTSASNLPGPTAGLGMRPPPRTETWPWASGDQSSPRKVAHTAASFAFGVSLPIKKHCWWSCPVVFHLLFSRALTAARGTSLYHQWPRHMPAATMGKDFSSWLCYPSSDYAAKADKNKQQRGLVQSTLPWHLPAQSWLFPHPDHPYHYVFVLLLTSLVQFVALLCKSDTMHICVHYGCVGVCKIMYFSSNRVFCYWKRPKWS